MREFTGHFCALFSMVVVVMAMVAVCSVPARAQNDTRQSASATMSGSGSPSATPDDQLSDSDAKKKELNKLIPNIAIERGYHTENDTADIMNLIASMPEGVQQSLMDDAEHAKNFCEHSTILSNFYNCSCYSLRIVNERIKKGPDVPFMDLIEHGQYKECVDMGLVAGYGQNRCDQTLTQLNVTTGQLNDICDCAGRVLARNYVVKPMPSIVFINYLFTDVLAACRAQYGF